MRDFSQLTVISDQTIRFQLSDAGKPVSYKTVLSLWQADEDFRTDFSNVLRQSPFQAFRWETPAITIDSVSRPFEFVLIRADQFVSRTPDSATYRDYFTSANDRHHGVVCFANLRNDAALVVPSPQTDESAYGHLAAFVRNAPEAQVDALWQVVATTVKRRLSTQPLWLSTAGGGVAWLHVRVDSRPKYYHHAPYRDEANHHV